MRDSYDPTPPSTWLGRARFTPVADALRGQLTARLDPRTLIAAAELPAPLPELIYTIVRRTRLWRREKVDVTRELIAHFADGLSAGRTPAQLAADFGPTAQAARLIRRGKIRNRPYLWHAGRFALRATGVATLVFVALYRLLMARFYFSAPTVSRNYWLEANEGRKGSDIAWPLYREALVKLGDPRDQHDHPRVDGGWLEEGLGGPHFAEVKSIVERQQESIRLIREGARKPRLGFLLGDPSDQEFYRATNADWLAGRTPPSADENLPLIGAILDGPQNLRELTRLLIADAYVAAAVGNGARIVEDYTAAFALSEQLYQPHSFLVEQLISLAIFGNTLSSLDQLLAEKPACLAENQLRKLAHRIAAYRRGNITIDFAAERALFDDILQRAYTDDGQGNGRITAAGLNLVQNLAATSPTDNIAGVTWIFGPGMSTLIAGRAETREMAEKFFDENLAAHQGPPWQWDAEKIQAPEKWLKDAAQSPFGFRYMFPALLLPGTAHVGHSAERTIQQRDATEVVIALVLFHRRHGAWPQKLDELVPDFLPAVPPDRFDGQPLRYVVRDGKPILYSIGVDRDDDGGRPTKDPLRAMPGPYGPASPDQHKGTDQDGDWILWPPMPATASQPVVAPPSAEEE